MDIKSLILIAGGVMIVAVIVHGVWIAWRARKNSLGMDIIPDSLLDDAEPGDRYPAELPNGGARVVGVNDEGRRIREKPPILMTPTAEGSRSRIVPSRRRSEFDDGSGDTDTVNEELFGTSDVLVTENRQHGARTPAAAQTPAQRTRNGYHPSVSSRLASTIENAMEVSREGVAGNGSTVNPEVSRTAVSARSAAADAAARPRVAEVNVAATPKSVKKRESLRDRIEESLTSDNRQEPPSNDAPAVISIYLMARRGTMIEGQKLYDALKAKGIMRGDMQIFHRINPISKIALYSVANAVNPGTFDFANIKALKVPGVVFFMQLEGLDHPVQAFEDMRRVASDVAELLGCEIKDENRSVVGSQTFDHYRERIADYARRRLSRRALS